MNVMRDPDAILAAWLEEGPVALPEVTRRAIAVTTRSTRQARPPMRMPWRTSPMTAFARLAIVAVAVAVAIGGAAYVLSPTNTVGPPPTTASPRPSATFTAPSAPTGAVDTSDWVAYTSNRYGFTISHPPTWTERAATGDWSMATDRVNFLTGNAEGFTSPDFAIHVSAFAVDIPADRSMEEWQTAYHVPSPIGCDVLESEPTTVDGRPAVISHTCGESTAVVFIGNRAFVFAVWQPNEGALLEAFLSTVRITSPDTPLTTPAPVRVGPLVAGTYVGRTLQVADIVAMMNDDDTLTPADRSDIVEALGIQGKTTWSVSIELTSERLTERQTVDGMSVVGSSGKHAFPDDHTLVYTETLRAADVVTEFELTVDGDSFRLHRTTPAHGAADEFVTTTIFESGPFELF